jgi:hypothetical protein
MVDGPEVIEVWVGAGPDQWGDHQDGTMLAKIYGCVIFPRGISTEADQRAATVLEGYTVIAPPDDELDIPTDAKIKWRGKTFEMIGEVGIHTFYDGDGAGLQINMKRTAG